MADQPNLPVESASIADAIDGDLPFSLRILIDDKIYTRTKQIASLMASDTAFTPKHLQGKPEACFTVINMALDWKLNPQFVAKCTYQTPGGSIGFEGKLVQAILEKSGRFVGGPKYEYRGNWSKLAGKFELKTGAKGGEYVAPTWTAADAIGLGIIARWQVRGEPEPRCWPGEDEPFWLTQCYPLNSPLWATDPKSQIQYLVIRRFANMAAPGILGGAAFDHEDLLDASERARDITPIPSVSEATAEEPADQRPVFLVTDFDGVIVEFRSPAMVQRALAEVFADAASRDGARGLAAAHENNQDTITKIEAADPVIAKAIIEDFQNRCLAEAPRSEGEAEEEDEAATDQGEVIAETTGDGTRMTTIMRETTDPSLTPPSMVQGSVVLPSGEVFGHPNKLLDASGSGSNYFPGSAVAAGSPQSAMDLGAAPKQAKTASPPQAPPQAAARPSQASSFFDQDDLELKPGRKNGKTDIATWATGQFLPRAGTARDAADLARLIGANEPHLQAYYVAHPKSKASVEQAIAAIYKRFE